MTKMLGEFVFFTNSPKYICKFLRGRLIAAPTVWKAEIEQTRFFMSAGRAYTRSGS